MVKGCYKITNRTNINTGDYWDTRQITGNTNNGTSALESIMEWIKEHADIKEDASVLDIGSGPCKPGAFLMHMKKHFKCNCISVDISKEICKTWEKENIESFNYVLPRLDFEDNTFDVILCSHVLEHIDEIEESAMEIKRVLKPNGIAIMNSPIGQGWAGEAEHVWWMGEELDFDIGDIITSFTGNQFNSLVQVYKK